MYTIDELTAGILDLASRTAKSVVNARAAAHEEEFHRGQRTEFRRSANDVPLAALRFLEDLRQVVDTAQSAIIHELATAEQGPTYTDIAVALGVSKQAGRKRAAAAAQWNAEHRRPIAQVTIEELVDQCVTAPPVPAPAMHWPDDGQIPETGPYGEPLSQEALARRALALGIGGAVNR